MLDMNFSFLIFVRFFSFLNRRKTIVHLLDLVFCCISFIVFHFFTLFCVRSDFFLLNFCHFVSGFFISFLGFFIFCAGVVNYTIIEFCWYILLCSILLRFQLVIFLSIFYCLRIDFSW